MPSPKPYRIINASSLPDSDWVADQLVPPTVPNVYAFWPGRATIEILPVWWDANTDTAVYDSGNVVVQPVEIKRVSGATQSVPDSVVVCNATISQTAPAFQKTSLLDTSADEMYLRVVSATPPGGATHLRLIVEVTP